MFSNISAILSELKLHRLFDRMECVLESAAVRRGIGRSLVVAFLTSLVAIEMKRREFLPPNLGQLIPGDSHFLAIDLTFGLLLIFEGLDLIFGFGRSVADTVGKQIEIFSLILLRKSFKEFSHFGEPLQWNSMAFESVGHILSDAFGALVIFLLLALYYRIQKHQPIAPGDHAQSRFIEQKKAIAFVLLAAYVTVGLTDTWLWLTESQDRLIPFFEVFYTLLIYVDILMVLISLQYSSSYKVAFRNSGFAVATVFLRVALVAPAYMNAILGVVATLYALGLTQVYNYFVVAKRTPMEKESGSTSPDPIEPKNGATVPDKNQPLGGVNI